MRLGAPIFHQTGDPEKFVNAHLTKGYRAAYCPEQLTVNDTEKIRQYRESLKKNDILLAEVGAWCNPLSSDPTEAEKNFQFTVERLALAEELQAKACVNIIGTSYPNNWYGPCKANFSEDFFIYAVEVSRKIIDAVKPKHTKMTFELMPFSFLDSPKEYLRFLKALDRSEAGIHFDPINCINSPRVLYDHVDFFQEAFRLLGEQIVSIHLKDIALNPEPFSVVLEEVPIGQGEVDYLVLLREIQKLSKDIPVMLEHLPDEQTFDEATYRVRQFATQAGITL
ncbi:sugar phosphate isomerase/epimerase family protein [Massiliimalia massiliensis]|uniref:sugar phosphate isomerase/epimerase family protein n=1 Tax=Massiliimalia massiliensis TaxID=1852384 RepID=UPI000986C681|nr:sugar phosphate isomerase/epimerase [Massiliimalia massiliensis]